jgi:hypothetical protein
MLFIGFEITKGLRDLSKKPRGELFLNQKNEVKFRV